ncbi:MAG: hypothetical protein K6F84_01170, partial [Lachnospiraceae bacterium]|nr:hypothetical protein [Lachnospiraceae bacterium]
DTDIQNIDVYECNYAEFNLGFVSDTSQILIDLDSSVEEIIERSGKQATPGAKYVPEVENIVPGDFVVKEKVKRKFDPWEAATVKKNKTQEKSENK